MFFSCEGFVFTFHLSYSKQESYFFILIKLALSIAVALSPLISGALTFIPTTFIPSENSTHTVGPSDNWNLELSDPHLFGPCVI